MMADHQPETAPMEQDRTPDEVLDAVVPEQTQPESDDGSSVPPAAENGDDDVAHQQPLQQADDDSGEDHHDASKPVSHDEQEEDDQEASEEIEIKVSPYCMYDYLSSRDTGRLFAHYYCLFCSATFKSVFEAYPHYSQHLEFYGPFVCACKNKYYDFDSLRDHRLKEHPHSDDLHFSVIENEDIQLWVDDLLESQRRGQDRLFTLNCSCALACNACAKFASPNVQLRPCTEHNEITFSEHVHSHFNLKSFLCKLCLQSSGKKYRIANINIDALNHLKTAHNFMAESPQQLISAFRKIINIPLLEEQLTEAIVNRKLIEEKFSLLARQQEARAYAVRQQQQQHKPEKQYHTVSKLKVILKDKQLVVAPYSRVRSIRHEYSVLPKNQQLFKGEPKHIHVADGKVVNLPSRGAENRNRPPPPPPLTARPPALRPPPLSNGTTKGPHSSSNHHDQRRPLKARIGGERSQRHGTSLMASQPAPRPPTLIMKLCCQYCNFQSPNRKLFTAHHLNQHPNLTVACTYSVK